MQAQYLARQPALARTAQELAHPQLVGRVCMFVGMGEYQRSLALPEVAVDLLAVAFLAAIQVEQVLGNLEGQPLPSSVAWSSRVSTSMWSTSSM